MASNEFAIVVIDDSENDDGPDSPTSNTSPEVLSFEQQEAIHLFSSITDISDTKAVKDSLEMFDYDVERTINKWIEQQHSYQRSPIADNSAAFRLINRNASRINSPVKRNLFTGMPKKLDLDTKVSVQKSAIKSIPSSSSSKVLSLSWHDCVERVLQSKEPFFIDADFPPTSKSLDGRQRRASENKGQRTLCACGVPAAAKVVQSDGPNYGRFYLSCGKQTQRRAPVLVVRKQDDAQNSADCQDEAKLLKDPPVTVNNPYAKSKPSTPSKHCRTNPSSPKSPPQRRSCTFFKWDPDGSIGASGYATRYSLFVWQHFGLENNCCLYRTSIDPSQVRQGAVGNCWFLSALAVVAEKSYLVRQLLPHDKLNPQGCYEVNLCLDGAWTPVLVDSTLPVVLQDVNKTTGGSLLQSLRHGVPLNSCKELVATPAFCSAPDLQLWPALVEKAYAKAHGSYAQLSGGFIAEGLTDLTGAPTETIIFSDLIDLDELWARLLSFHQAGFLVGVATSRGGEGLVGGHAYSLLDVIEINNSLIGEQKKVTDYFSSPSKKHRKLTGPNYDTCAPIRLVRIRNPWGKREWKGDWSVDSERWTRALRKKIGSDAFARGDGTFFMSFEDMLQRFHHMDIAKTREGWKHSCSDGIFQRNGDPIASSKYTYEIIPSCRTWAFVSLVQKKKRANSNSKYWYCDPSMLILKRRSDTEEWTCEASVLTGIGRMSDCEIFLDPDFSYMCVLVSCIGCMDTPESFEFRLSTYSSEEVTVRPVLNERILCLMTLRLLHKLLLNRGHKLLYPVAPFGVLSCIHGSGCLYFVAVNGACDEFLSIRLTLDIQEGMMLVYGKSGDSFDIPPRRQQILAIVSRNGKRCTCTHLSFRYLSSTIKSSKDGSHVSKLQYSGMRGSVELGLAADLLTSSSDSSRVCIRGGDSLEIYQWIPQVGSCF